MKKEMSTRAMKTKSALESLNAHQRIAMEGFRPGTYLRLRFTGEFCTPASRLNERHHKPKGTTDPEFASRIVYLNMHVGN